MRQRIEEIDFLKGILIILMISFHLVYFSEMYPYAKRVVYTFHMPGFLVISGYLMNISKKKKDLLTLFLGYAIPYLIMESGYILMAAVLPIREHIDHLSIGIFFDKLFLHPLGPYWYLHTLVICGMVYTIVFRLLHLKSISKIILLGLLFYLISDFLGIMTFACSMYFLAGVAVRKSQHAFTDIFRPSPLSVIAFVILILHPGNLGMGTVGGVLIVYLFISSVFFLYTILYRPCRSLVLYLGKNTLYLFLFSPIFTFLCKPLIPWLRFDPTGILFLLASLLICITGSLLLKWVMTKTGLNRLLFLR